MPGRELTRHILLYELEIFVVFGPATISEAGAINFPVPQGVYNDIRKKYSNRRTKQRSASCNMPLSEGINYYGERCKIGKRYQGDEYGCNGVLYATATRTSCA